MDGPLAKSIPWYDLDGMEYLVLDHVAIGEETRSEYWTVVGEDRSSCVCSHPGKSLRNQAPNSTIILGLFPYMKLKQYLHILKYCFLPCLKVYVFFMDVIEIKMLHVQVSCHRTGCNVLNNTLIYY